MSTYYPQNNKAIYYVEFNRGETPNEFTLFKRQFFYSEEQLLKLKKEAPNDFVMSLFCNEAHPWNIFTANYGPDGTMPDKKWVEFMVDSLNRNTPYSAPIIANIEKDEELDLDRCGNCDEIAWDGRICHLCGAKDI